MRRVSPRPGQPSNCGDTWEWTASSGIWEQRTSTVAPSPRHGHVMTYEADRPRVLLFGGHDGSFRQDLWEWDGTAWTELTPTGASPAPRRDAGLIYDPSRSRAVLFGGGENDGANPRQDTWEWDSLGRTWTERTVTSAEPQARSGHAFAYDPIAKVAVIFGGSTGYGYLSDIWDWNGSAGTWTERKPASVAPSARLAPSMLHDPKTSRMVLVSGYGNGTTLDEVWSWNIGDSTWANLGSAAPMPSRYFHAAAFDSSRSKVMVFGGVSVPTAGANTVLGDLWER